jgi:hypothetical protein
MTTTELYKFITETASDYRFDEDGMMLVWIYHDDISEFTELLGYNCLDEGGFDVRLQEHYICVDLKDIHGMDADLEELDELLAR